MKKLLTFVSVLFVCLVLTLAAGCSQPASVPQATPAPTAEETAIATSAATPVPTTVSLTPGPTETLPSAWAIDVQVESNSQTIDPQIIATFRGGKGQNLISGIDVIVTRSDGVVEEALMTQPFTVGKSVSLPGTTQNKDRAEVWAITPQGDRVKIFDAYIPFRQY